MDPFGEGVGLNVGLGDVVEDELLVGVAVDEADGFGELAGDDQDVVYEPGGEEGGDAAVEGGIVEEAGRLGLDYVAETFEEGVLAEGFEGGREIFCGDGGPAYYSSDEGELGGEVEEPRGFFEGLAGLDGYGGVDAGGCAGEVCGVEVALEDGHGFVYPVEFLGCVVPEMMVGVDAHRCLV